MQPQLPRRCLGRTRGTAGGCSGQVNSQGAQRLERRRLCLLGGWLPGGLPCLGCCNLRCQQALAVLQQQRQAVGGGRNRGGGLLALPLLPRALPAGKPQAVALQQQLPLLLLLRLHQAPQLPAGAGPACGAHELLL